jgi:hypothetical protein
MAIRWKMRHTRAGQASPPGVPSAETPRDDVYIYMLHCSTPDRVPRPANPNLSTGSTGQEDHHAGDDSCLPFWCHLWEHRQRNNLPSRHLGHREVSRLVPERRVGSLQMQWHRVVDPRGDPRLRQMAHEAFSVWDTDDVQVKHRFSPLKWASPNRARRRGFSGCTSNKKGDEFEAVTVRTVYSHLDYIEGSEPLAIRLWSSLPTLISGTSAFSSKLPPL